MVKYFSADPDQPPYLKKQASRHADLQGILLPIARIWQNGVINRSSDPPFHTRRGSGYPPRTSHPFPPQTYLDNYLEDSGRLKGAVDRELGGDYIRREGGCF